MALASSFMSIAGQSTAAAPQPTSSGVVYELESLMHAYDPAHPLCRFRHAFYNLVSADDVHRYVRPAHIPEGLWNDAIRASPDPSCLVPVFASGWPDLQKRVEHQTQASRQHHSKLKDVNDMLEKIKQKHEVETTMRLVKCQREYIRIAQKVIKVMKMVQVLRAKTHTTLTPDEEQLSARLSSLVAQFNQQHLHARLAAIQAQIKPGEKMGDNVFEVVDERAVDDLYRVLEQMQNGLTSLTEVLKDDLKTADALTTSLNKR